MEQQNNQSEIMAGPSFVERSKITFSVAVAGNLNNLLSMIGRRSTKLQPSNERMSSKVLWLYPWVQHRFYILKESLPFFFCHQGISEACLKTCVEIRMLGKEQWVFLQFLHSSTMMFSDCCAEQDSSSSHYPFSDLVCVLSLHHSQGQIRKVKTT